MRSVRVLSRFRLPALLTLVIATPAFAAWPHDPSDNLPISRAAGNQIATVTTADGAGGAYVGWQDQRSDAGDIYLQHVSASGTITPGWPADGLAICTAAGIQGSIALTADGGGGVYVGWDDQRSGQQDVYLTRVLGNGTIAPGWTANGVLVSSGFNSVTRNDYQPRLSLDGAGGLYVVWTLAFGAGDDDIYISRWSPAGAVMPGFPLPVDANSGEQIEPSIVTDPTGQAQVVYADGTGSGYDIRYRRMEGTGGLTGGNVFNYSASQVDPFIVADGLGGVVVAFTDGQLSPGVVSVMRLNGGGSLTWGPIPAINQGTFGATAAAIATDGSRGAYVAGSYGFLVPNLAITHVTSGGGIASGWPAAGLVIGSDFTLEFAMAPDLHGNLLTLLGASGSLHVNRLDGNGIATRGWPTPPSYVNPTYAFGARQGSLCDDGKGGAIAAWGDLRSGADQDLYSQRVEKFGALGNPEPAPAGVKDVANDQGGKVRVSWIASYLDADPVFGVSSYRIWRQVPAATALGALASGRATLEDGGAREHSGSEGSSAPRLFRTTELAAQTIYWETIGTQVAAGQAGYSFVANTEGDSVGAGNPRTLFMVEALGYSGQLWDSAPDSGYSVDNLPPAAPAPFTGAFNVSLTHLSWGRNSEPDLAGYRLYRGVSPGFVPSSATWIAQQPDTGYVASPGSWYYKLTAIDLHGNESAASLVSPTGTVSAPSSGSLVLDFRLASPNPSRGPASFRLALPREARVSARLFDTGGRLVRTLAEGTLSAGEHTLAWDGRDLSGGDVPAGIYFVRTVADGRAFGVRVVRLN